MDLIYAKLNSSIVEDVGVLHDYSFDLAFGADENDFELTLDIDNHCCEPNYIVYAEGTEYGGIIDKIGVKTAEEKLIYMGRTWQGMLASKIIEPDEGETHFTVSGNANLAIRMVLAKIGLQGLFVAGNTNDTKLTIENYSFDRYTDAYSGLRKMLLTVSAKLKFTVLYGKVVISAEPIVDYSKDEQFDNDTVDLDIEKTYNGVNHIICLGKGEGTKREVVHLYLDESKNVTETKIDYGLREIVEVLDYPNAENRDELIKSGTERLAVHASDTVLRMNFSSEDTKFDVGDIIGAKELTIGIVTTEKITKKIVTINAGEVNIQYKVGE